MNNSSRHTVTDTCRLVSVATVTIVLAGFSLSAFAEVRTAPLRSLPKGKVIHVADFGAKANDGMDDLPAIQAAIDAARGIQTPVRIVLGEGRFGQNGRCQFLPSFFATSPRFQVT